MCNLYVNEILGTHAQRGLQYVHDCVCLCVRPLYSHISRNYAANKRYMYERLQCRMVSKNKKAKCFVRMLVAHLVGTDRSAILSHVH